MVIYHNTHVILNQKRIEAKQASAQGPRTIVVGPVDAGKSTLCRILVNYAVRSGWEPLFVDLDIGQGELCPPGSISACPIHVPVDAQEGYPAEVRHPLHIY
jgi:polyribonucleotide 5'-hydroxyl-kinase